MSIVITFLNPDVRHLNSLVMRKGNNSGRRGLQVRTPLAEVSKDFPAVLLNIPCKNIVESEERDF